MSQNNKEEFSVQEVFNAISNYLKNEQLYERLLNVLHEDADYKRLLKTGENQYLDGPSETTIEAEHVKSRLCCAKLNYLVVQVDNGIDKIVREKFQGEFLDKLKDEVLQAILLLSSKQINSSDVTCQVSAPVKSRRGRKKKAVLSQTKSLTNNCTQNGSNIKKTVRGVINGHAQSAIDAEGNKEDGDFDIGSLFSLDSVSSVHTSDLSSFEDEISLSSEEEFGSKKRLSLKEVQEKLEKSKSDDMDEEEDNEQAMSNQIEDEQSDFPVNNGSSNVSQKSQRRRKPNLKYNDDDKMLSVKRKKKFSSSRSVCGDTPRKRGRPRKYST